jgi:hypothetical protein
MGDLSNLSPNSVMRCEAARWLSISVVIAIARFRHNGLNTDNCSTWHSMNGMPLLNATLISEDQRISFSSLEFHSKEGDWKKLKASQCGPQ